MIGVPFALRRANMPGDVAAVRAPEPFWKGCHRDAATACGPLLKTLAVQAYRECGAWFKTGLAARIIFQHSAGRHVRASKTNYINQISVALKPHPG
jgi:hypothetical protein